MVEIVAQAMLPVDEKYEIKKNRIQKGTSNKRICIVTGTHGDELEGQYVCFRLQKILSQRDDFNGIVDIYPSLNPLGMDSMNRKVPFFDLDMNRVFPGDNQGSLVESVAYDIVKDLEGANLVVDIHASNVYLKEIPQIRINETQAENLVPLAKLMNVDYVWVHSSSTVLESTLAYSLNALNTPTLVVEMGVGLRITKEYCHQLVDGILHTMKELGMLTKTVPDVKEPIVSLDSYVHFLNARYAGLFLPEMSHDHFVEEGSLIGKIVDPLNGKVLDNVYSPCHGLLFTLREYPLVNEGSLIGRILER